MIRWLLRIIGLGALLGIGFIGYGYWLAQQPPTVREASVAVAGWPDGEPPRTILLVTDTHVAGPDMPPERLAAIVDRLNALRPDLIVLTGDYVSDKKLASHRYSVDQAIAPLARLKARLGVVGVLGNHDYWRDPKAFRGAFARHGIPLLENSAMRRGPFVVGGVDDEPTGHHDMEAMEDAMAALGPGPQIVISHSPDIAPLLSLPVAAVLAGHTHCGQISLPFLGPIVTMSHYGTRFACGRIEYNGSPLFVSAGIGTSILPLRIGAAPDVWLIRFGPKP